jgi:hypothetical protein
MDNLDKEKKKDIYQNIILKSENNNIAILFHISFRYLLVS